MQENEVSFMDTAKNVNDLYFLLFITDPNN
jgi:hypothetical protein